MKCTLPSHATSAADSPRPPFLREGAPSPEEQPWIDVSIHGIRLEGLDGVAMPVDAEPGDTAPHKHQTYIGNGVGASGSPLAAATLSTPPALVDLASPFFQARKIARQRSRGKGGSQAESVHLVHEWIATRDKDYTRSQYTNSFNCLLGYFRDLDIPMFPIRPEVIAVVFTMVEANPTHSGAKLARTVMSWAVVKTAPAWPGEIRRTYLHLNEAQLQRKISKDFRKNRYFAALL